MFAKAGYPSFAGANLRSAKKALNDVIGNRHMDDRSWSARSGSRDYHAACSAGRTSRHQPAGSGRVLRFFGLDDCCFGHLSQSPRTAGERRLSRAIGV